MWSSLLPQACRFVSRGEASGQSGFGRIGFRKADADKSVAPVKAAHIDPVVGEMLPDTGSVFGFDKSEEVRSAHDFQTCRMENSVQPHSGVR